MNHVDLLAGWNALIRSIEGASGPLLFVLAAVGVAIIVFMLIKWAYDRRRGGGVGGFPWMGILLGAALAAPKAIIPLVLVVLGFIINFVIDFVGAFVR